MDALNEFVRQVVASRRDIGLRHWPRWMHHYLGSRPYHWLRADYVLPSHFLVIEDSETADLSYSGRATLVDSEFCEVLMPYF